MRACDIVENEFYRLESSPNYGWAKAIEVIKPKQKSKTPPYTVNPKTYIIVKCEHATDKSGVFGIVRYFKARDLIKPRPA